MSRGQELSETVRSQIVILRDHGISWADIGRELNLIPSTVRKIYLRCKSSGTYSSASRSGRPKSLDKHDLRRLKAYITTNRYTRREPLGELLLNQNLSISERTLRRKITEDLGFRHRIERRKPHLSLKQKEARLRFAKEHIHWGLEEWQRVAWSDEMSMQTDANQGQKWVWRYPEEEYIEDCCRATVIPGFRKVKIWAAMRFNQLSELVIIPEKEGDGKMNAEEYCDIIMDGEMFDFWVKGSEEIGCLLMMEDGAAYHKGCATKRRKELEEVGWIGWGPGTWPSNSPDLNPIENLWHILRSNIRKRKVQPRTKEALIEALQEEWSKLDIEMVNKLCESMPRRLQAVINARGGTTKY